MTHNKIIPAAIFIIIGVLFILSNYGIIPDVWKLWPLILIAIGIGILFRKDDLKKK